MVTFITVIYVLVCIFLILVVLLQAGKGGGMGAAFGGSSQTVFGGAGAGNFLTRLTVVSAALFMFLSATLAYLSSSGEQSLDRAAELVKEREAARQLGGTAAEGDSEDGAATSEEVGGATSSPDDAEGDEAPAEGDEAATEGDEAQDEAPAMEPLEAAEPAEEATP